MTAKDMIMRMPEVFKAEAAGDTVAIIQYEISEPVYQVVQDGQLTVHEGVADAPSLTIRMKDEDLIKLFSGKLNPMMAFMSGKIKLKGDMKLAQTLAGFIDRDKVSRLA